MKKNLLYAMIGAIALTGAVGLISCTDEDVAEVNPNYDPETNSVVVDLALNISTANTPTTRMSSAATQATTDDPFRGISDARLFTFAQTTNGTHLAAATPIGKRYDLSQVVTQGQISEANSRRVLEMSLPLKTNTLVFYGRATDGEASGGKTAKELYGSLVSNPTNGTATNMSDITFTVEQRLNADKLAEYRKVEKLLAGILTCIMNTSLENVTGDVAAATVVGDNAYNYALTANEIKNIKWSDYAANSKSPFTPTADQYELEKALANAYKQVTTIQGNGGELRAASGEAILETIEDLWSVVNRVRNAGPFCKEEAVAKRLAVEIYAEIGKYFTIVTTNGNIIETVTFNDAISTMITTFLVDPYWPCTENSGDAGYDANYDRTEYGLTDLTTTLSGFPKSYGLPMGASHITFNTTKKVFEYPSTFNSSGMGSQTFTVTDYLYSPELCYFGNSPIRVSNNTHKVSDYPNGANATAATENTTGGWNLETNWPAVDWSSNYVTAASRSVAMKNDINYGTALLKTTVSLGATTLRDNNHAVQKSFNSSITDTKVGGTGADKDEYATEPDNKIDITKDGAFTLTGIIVGGQSRNVGWDFLPKAVGSTPAYEYGFVTDTAIPATAASVPKTGNSGANYTLLFDNYDASKAVNAQNVVYVALELKNNTGHDFYGNYNLIRDQGTFYLVGVLDPTKAGLTTPTWPTYHALPPYNADGTSKQAVRVFMQDYMTTVNFKIGENSLKYAYLTVPDLRSSSLTLGLSVDIKWETGIDFGDVVLGNSN